MHEEIVVHGLRIIFFKLLLWPQPFLPAEIRMVGVKAIDELLAVYILLVLRAAVPEMRVPVDHEDLFAVFGFKHGIVSLIPF
jgi:hypothetical protein